MNFVLKRTRSFSVQIGYHVTVPRVHPTLQNVWTTQAISLLFFSARIWAVKNTFWQLIWIAGYHLDYTPFAVCGVKKNVVKLFPKKIYLPTMNGPENKSTIAIKSETGTMGHHCWIWEYDVDGSWSPFMCLCLFGKEILRDNFGNNR